MKASYYLIFFLFSQPSWAFEPAEKIFAQLTPSLYQIKLIDKASGEKSSIGSGFQISADGLIATNYHVIASHALTPEKYDIEYLDHEGSSGRASLENVDIVNDLALIKRSTTVEMPYFTIAATSPRKGEELFALGNPHDLGMIVVPGTYNGLKKESFNERIHFTGAINSGMSGGPVVNALEQVVGINVATSGNQIGFLIPHEKLLALVEHYQSTPALDIKQQINNQLFANQQKLMHTLLESEWQIKTLANKALIPIIDVPFIRCWGDSNADKPDTLILGTLANCTLDERTFISSKFFTGNIELQYKYMKAKNLKTIKFYHLYQQQFSHAAAGNNAKKEDVSEFECQYDRVKSSPPTFETQGIESKVILCIRAYKEYQGLFDALYLSASIDKNQQALVSHFTLSGVSQENILLFSRKFMESVSWK